MAIKKVAVIGAGTMGNGIAHVCALSGYEVRLMDIEQAFLEMGVASVAFPGLEADDVVATIACKARTAGAEVTVVEVEAGHELTETDVVEANHWLAEAIKSAVTH